MSESEPDALRRSLRLLWPNLPLLLTGSVLVAAGWVLVRAVSKHAGSISILGVGLLVVPLFAALLNAAESLLDDDHVGIPQFVRSLGRSFGRAAKLTALPTGAAFLMLETLLAWQLSGQAWMLASLGLSATATVAALYAGVIALPYAVRTGAALRKVWLVGLYVATRNPVLVLGVVSAVVLTAWAAAYLSFALILLLPGPLALVWSAAVSTAEERSRARLLVDARGTS
jgi:hypothetical protein